MKKTRREFLQILSTFGAAVATGIGTGVHGHAGATLTIPAGFEWDFVTPSHDDQVEAVRWLYESHPCVPFFRG